MGQRLPRPQNTQDNTGSMVWGESGARPPRETCPSWELTLVLRQTGLPHALGAQDVPCRGSKECLPGLLLTGQPSCWTRSDNTSPLLSGVRKFAPPPPAPSQGQGAISTGVSWEADVKSGMGPGLANRATGHAGAWGGHGAGQWHPALQPGGQQLGRCGQRWGPGSWYPQLSGLSTLVPETDGHSMRPSHPLRQVRLEVLDGRGGRARKPDLPSQGGWGRAVVSSASQEGLRPDCTKAQGLD